jgi:ABC-type antimicrobial peptide transport system permease subunit
LFLFITGLLAGSYPALYLSSFHPIHVLKGTFRTGRMASLPRKVLVVAQFTVSVMLIIGTLIVYQQIQHAKNRPVGYSRHGLINVGMEKEIRDHFEAVYNELKNTGAVVEMAASNSPMTQVWNSNGGFDWEGKDPSMAVDFPNHSVSWEFGKTVQWKILEGRDFSRTFATDSLAFVINQAAAKFLGFQNPVGKTLKWEDRPFTIIGVVADIMQESPFYPVRPTLYHIGTYDNMYNLIMRLDPKLSAGQSLSRVEEVWKKYAPAVPLDYKFVDEEFGTKFSAEERIGRLASYFAVLAVLISCLGLFGLASFVAEQRTKEIGIRKILGASVPHLWRLLSMEFVLLVIFSCILAAPVAWYYLNNWLNDYDYRITIRWPVFLLAAVLALLITLLTVSFQAIKAALANPVKNLRTE